MTKSEFMYKYIEECMSPLCLYIILRENYNLWDDSKIYESIACQFQRIMDKFHEMKNHRKEEEQDELLANVRQEILKKIAEDIKNLFTGVDTDDLNQKLMKEKLDDSFFLALSQDLRNKEEKTRG